MNLTIEFEHDPGLELQRLARQFKEDARQATARLAVATGKAVAQKSVPWGLTTKAKKTIEKNVRESAQRCCYVVKDAQWLRTMSRNADRARVKFRQWEQIKPGQMMSDPAAINRRIDRIRKGKANPPRYIDWDDMVVCSQTAFNRAMTLRRKRVGMDKGGWLGAGIAAASLQGGKDRAKIGKNVANWAQKHTRQGSARWAADGVFMLMTNRAPNASNLISDGDLARAYDSAWRITVRWYHKAIRRRERELNR